MAKKILFLVAPQNFRDEEYFITKEVLDKKGFETVTASKSTNVAISKFGKEVKVDVDIYSQYSKKYDAIVLVGGSGASVYFEDEKVHALLESFFKEKKVVGAICIAPMILVYSGLVKNRNMTVWNEDKLQEKEFEKKGINFIDEDVVVDENLISANGPKAAYKFGEKLSESLK